MFGIQQGMLGWYRDFHVGRLLIGLRQDTAHYDNYGEKTRKWMLGIERDWRIVTFNLIWFEVFFYLTPEKVKDEEIPF